MEEVDEELRAAERECGDEELPLSCRNGADRRGEPRGRLPERLVRAVAVRALEEHRINGPRGNFRIVEERHTGRPEVAGVREAEGIARRIAYDKVRKKDRAIAPEIVEIEEELTEKLGTRVHIERKTIGGKITIDFFSSDDLQNLINLITNGAQNTPPARIDQETAQLQEEISSISINGNGEEDQALSEAVEEIIEPKKEEGEDLYNIKGFSI